MSAEEDYYFHHDEEEEARVCTARTLRGENHYTAKTLCGNWVEDMHDPSFEAVADNSKFDANFLSTAQRDMRDGVGMVSKRFGAGFDMYDNVKVKDEYP